MKHDPDDDFISDLRMQAFGERQYRAILARNPDCRDPSHPGCERCEDRDGNPIETEQEEAA